VRKSQLAFEAQRLDLEGVRDDLGCFKAACRLAMIGWMGWRSSKDPRTSLLDETVTIVEIGS